LESPVHTLQRYLQEGATVGLFEEIADVLDYANNFLKTRDGLVRNRDLITRLDAVIDQILDGDLGVSEADVVRSHLPLLKIHDRIIVYGKAIFKAL